MSMAFVPNRAVSVALLALLVSAGTLVSCSSGPSQTPITDMRNPALSENARIEAMELAWSTAKPGTPDREMARNAMKDLVWSPATPSQLRIRIVGNLLDSSDPKESADAREMAKLILPREKSRQMVTLLSDIAGTRGWDDFVPPLIRSYSRWIPEVKDSERAERIALNKLAKGRPVEHLVFDAFVAPPDAQETYGMNWQDRLRSDAWDLLGRLDADGSMRIGLITSLDAPGIVKPDDRVLQTIRACFKELRSIPLTGDELKWAMRLRDPKITENATWWEACRGVIAGLEFDRTGPLSLRHAEPIRWASQHRSEWLSMTRAELKNLLTERLKGRAFNVRSAETPPVGRPYRESIEAWDDRLRWGDFLSLLVIDEALQEPNIAPALLRFADLDRKDTTTEYGGIIRQSTQAETTENNAAKFITVLYPPRPGQRMGDTQFIASDDMVANSDLALLHFHFHAQSTSNRSYSGPSYADLEYARRYGRNCIVFTSVSEGVLGIDYYQSNFAVIDMGQIPQNPPKKK
jgi:(2Fe-2S) ferredoxin